MDRCAGHCDTPKWVADGDLLENGACIERTYRKSVIPEKGITKVYTSIMDQKVRDVNDRKQVMTIDFTLTMQWMDPGIKTNFSEEDTKNAGILPDVEQLKLLWNPDVYIYNLSDYKSYLDSNQISSFVLLQNNEFNLMADRTNIMEEQTKPVVKYTVEATSTIYCAFDLTYYPMDSQTCELRIGSKSSGTTFVLHDPNRTYHNLTNYMAENFNITVTFFDRNLNNGNNIVGFNITMARILTPFIMEYYLPSVAIVLVSPIGFLIPLTAIPGRVALLVTQFLTITNLFIHQMVCIL